jgi:hypothetical protein
MFNITKKKSLQSTKSYILTFTCNINITVVRIIDVIILKNNSKQYLD